MVLEKPEDDQVCSSLHLITPEVNMNRSKTIISGVIALVLIFTGVFAAVRLFAAEPEAVDDVGPGVKVIERVFDDGSGPVTITTIIEPSPELPDRTAEAAGVLAALDGDRLLVGTGSISVDVENVNGKERVTTEHSGPEIEVIVNSDTVIYRDVTEIVYSAAEDAERRIQQSVQRIDNLDGLPSAAEIQAWGVRDGDSLLAEVLVYREIR
jgi:hypothetical protein